MTLEGSSPPASPTAKFIGHAFVEQYYHILHQSPELVYRFYQECSVLSRPDSDGVMTSVTTMQGINGMILSLDYKEYKAEIETADAQKSCNDGVTVLVTGNLTGKDNLKRKFAQSFFLAPQKHGFFVLNDVFRYIEGDSSAYHQVKEVVDASTDPDPAYVPDPPVPDLMNGNQEPDKSFVEEVNDASNHETRSINEESLVIEQQTHSHENDVPVEVESPSDVDDGPKKSYASIVKVAKGSPVLTKVYVHTSTVKTTPKLIETQSHVSSSPPARVPEALALSNASAPENRHDNEEVEGHSIFIRNLPFSVTDTQLETEFKKFGPIKQGGIQVRNNRQQGYCFGLIEFESLSSMENAIKASPVTIGGRQAAIEIKRTTARAVGSSGRGGGELTSSSRGWGRVRSSDSFRGRGSYGNAGGQSFSRNTFSSNQGEFASRGQGARAAGRRGEGYQHGRGRGRGGGPRHDAFPAAPAAWDYSH